MVSYTEWNSVLFSWIEKKNPEHIPIVEYTK